MTNVLLATYPDLFEAGVSFAGVPHACFAGEPTWSTECATGRMDRTPREWGDLVRAAYPGYTGPRPRVQLWHGTEDDVLSFENFGEAVEQWTDVHGVGQTPTRTEQDFYGPGRVRTTYGSGQVQAVQETGQGHNLQIVSDQALAFFGLRSGVVPSPWTSGAHDFERFGDDASVREQFAAFGRNTSPWSGTSSGRARTPCASATTSRPRATPASASSSGATGPVTTPCGSGTCPTARATSSCCSSPPAGSPTRRTPRRRARSRAG
ncbi:hypothetical protein NUM3379_18470 [Kineococcus sp. NUM-3379]